MSEEEKAELIALLTNLRHLANHSYHDEITEAVDTITNFLASSHLHELQKIWEIEDNDTINVPILKGHEYTYPIGIMRLNTSGYEISQLLASGLFGFEFGGVWKDDKFTLTEVSIVPKLQPRIAGARPLGETHYGNP